MFQLFKFFIRSLFLKKYISAEEVCISSFRVMPWDCDPNMHMTNSRYFRYMDYARFWRYFNTGVFKKVFINSRWMPMATAQEITYIKDIAPFEKFSVHTRLAGWDDKYIYMAQDFYGKKGLCAKAMMRGVFAYKKKPVPIRDVLEMFGNPEIENNFQDRLKAWRDIQNFKKSEAVIVDN